MKSALFLDDLTEFINNNLTGNLYIQTHNYPDADAVASAFALQHLLKEHYGLTSELVYDGEIQRQALLRMIQTFGVCIAHSRDFSLRDEDFIIIVDGCKGNKNVTDLVGEEIAVIDHHEVCEPEDVRFHDIRPPYGSCGTIMCDYYNTLGVELPMNIASTLQIGLLQDTDNLTRGVCEHDLQAFNTLYLTADQPKVQYAMRNNIELKDLDLYKLTIDHLRHEGTLGFCYLPESCPPPLLGILGDFLLSLEELEFIAIFARNGERINVSFRNEIGGVNCARVIANVLEGIGSGGGHRDLAGGIIPRAEDFEPERMFSVIKEQLGSHLKE